MDAGGDGWDKFYRTVIEETQRGVEELLDRFRISLGDWFYPAINWPTPDWRDQLYLFVEHTRYYGLEIEQVNIDRFRELIEARVCGTGPFSHLGPYRWDQPQDARATGVQLAMGVAVDDGTRTDAPITPPAQVILPPFQRSTVGAPEFTEATARTALLKLHNLWIDNGYELAPQLLFWFLAKNTDDHDLSDKYSSMVSGDARYRFHLENYVKDLAKQYGEGMRSLPDKENALKVEWLGHLDINYFHPFTSAGDLNYAIGTGWFKYTNASLDVMTLQSGFKTLVTTTFKATMTLVDDFAFWRGRLRELFSAYRAGAHLQNDLSYKPVRWHVTWSESITVQFHLPDVELRTPRNVD